MKLKPNLAAVGIVICAGAVALTLAVLVVVRPGADSAAVISLLTATALADIVGLGTLWTAIVRKKLHGRRVAALA